jgi:histone H3/H4
MLLLVVFWNGGGGIMGALPNAVVKRLLSEHGGGLRVSGTALERAVAAAENYISRLAAEASASATAAKRKTVMDSDIDTARAKLSQTG